MSAFEESLIRFPLLGGLNAAELFPSVNLALIGWLPLIFAPRWKYTEKLSIVPPIIHSILYATTVISLMTEGGGEPIDFSTLEGVVAMFKDPNGVFAGWMHYVAFDLIVARTMVFDSVARGASLKFHAIAVVPCLLGTFVFGPAGWLSYMCLRSIFLGGNNKRKAE